MIYVPCNVGVKSFFKIEAAVPLHEGDVYAVDGDKPGSRRLLADWFPNTVLDTGRHAMASQNWLSWCQVGTNNTEPQVTDTGLLGWINGTSTQPFAAQIGAQPGVPYYGWKRLTFRHAQGSVAAILNEVAVGWGSGSAGGECTTRALILNSVGAQVPVVPLPNEYLDVTVEFRCYPPASDFTSVTPVNFDGVDYDYTVRALAVTDATAWASRLGSPVTNVCTSNSAWSAYDGVLGAVTASTPVGTPASSDNSNAYNGTYLNNYQLTMGMNVGPTGWVLGAGIPVSYTHLTLPTILLV